MEQQQVFDAKEEYWRLQEALDELSATQIQHLERIMRLEKRQEDSTRVRSVWGPSSPFPSALGAGHHDSTLNPAAEAFRNFDAEPGTGVISSLSLDNNEDARRGAASRANSVRFDESANNHYGQSRQSIDPPPRTGSGLGTHPLSERSLSHRSDGRGSSAGFGRTNSFGLEQSRLLGSIHNSPRVSGNPPPGFFVLGPCPAIIRCWVTETFSNDSLLYAAICTGSAASYVGLSLLQKLNLDSAIMEENGLRKIKLAVYLTEAKIQLPSSRSASPAPQVPTLTTKFVVDGQPGRDKSIQIILGSDVLRSHSADVLLSQDRLVIFDAERNQLSVPFVRPEDDTVYKHLRTGSRARRASNGSDILPPPAMLSQHSTPGIIGRPGRLMTDQVPMSPPLQSPDTSTPAPSEGGDFRRSEPPSEILTRSSTDLGQGRGNEEAKSPTESEQSITTPMSKSSSGVWANSWRSSSGAAPPDASATAKTAANYARPTAPRNMKVLRPTKSTATSSRTASSSSPFTTSNDNVTSKSTDTERTSSTGEPKTTKSNPIGSGSAFGWLNSGQQRKATSKGS